MNSTVDYYNKNAQEYSKRTCNIDMSKLYIIFERYLQVGDSILDLGCGSGRDSRYFNEKGYRVTAVDASINMCEIVRKIDGIDVINEEFDKLDLEQNYNGIWACASLLHIKKEMVEKLLRKLLMHLCPGGVMYASWKYGHREQFEGERFYSYLDEKELKKIVKNITGIVKYNIWLSEEVRDDKTISWINIIIEK